MAIRKTPKSFNYSKEDMQEAFLKGLLEAYLKGNIKTKTQCANISGQCKSNIKGGLTRTQYLSRKIIIPTLLKKMFGGSLIQIGILIMESIGNCKDL